MKGIALFMNTEDSEYKELPQFKKYYSIRQHLLDNEKADKYRDRAYWRGRLARSQLLLTIRNLMDLYWDKDLDYSLVDVGAKYGAFSLAFAKYIKTSGHKNKVYAFDCGNARKLAEYNVKLNQLDNLITFEPKAVANASIPQLVYYDPEHFEDDHIVRRGSVSLSSYVVDGISLDDYFLDGDSERISNLIIKIDAQGVEPLIFEGMKKILESIPPVIFEFTPWVFESIERDPILFLQSFPDGYNLYNINEEENHLEKISASRIANFVRMISNKRSPFTDLLLLHQNGFIDTLFFEDEFVIHEDE